MSVWSAPAFRAPHYGMPDHYKIKLRQLGYRLVYRVDDGSVTVLVVAVGKRERGDVYNLMRAHGR
ncbi:addiction module antitoxin [Sinorhizobium meliloti CCNWSX0020]|uniref:Addiction module antitoxin n=1 Tax=Sinorhizobium meliloti CCNWSX0020 TaxID=1107881 RepID=H0G8E0_RHIML|nr:addiction module antitoxin [Sinorhizobium meliloti CCNWSX0020]